MRGEEKILFDTFLATHPDFLQIKNWEEGNPDPPDVIATDAQSRKIGVELTEWLDETQTSYSITTEKNEAKWLNALNSENHSPPAQFVYVLISFRPQTKFSVKHAASFCKEFYALMSYIDSAWEHEMAWTPQKIWNDFSEYPILGKEIDLIHFEHRETFRPTNGARWTLGMGKGGAFDPRQGTSALLERIEEKRTKPNYAALKTERGLAELVLLIHHGIRGLLHNDPVEGSDWKLADTIREALADLAKNPGPFDRVFLYLAYNEGELFQLYPPNG